MAHLIDKDALVAEIKERIKTYNKGYANGDDSRADALEVLLHDIDTLEVKEVELEKELEDFLEKNSDSNGFFNPLDVAKHFFELGIKSKSSYVSTPNIDDTLKEMGVDPDSKSAKSFKEFYYMALEKFKAQKGERV